MRVTVLYGGPSAEREVSLVSGRAVAQGLRDAGHEVFEADVRPETLDAALAKSADVVFPVLHGEWGEDGGLQLELERRELRFVGSGSQAARLGMNKVETKRVWRSAGLPTPDYAVFERSILKNRQTLSAAWAACGPPNVIKAVDSGSSIDVFICKAPDDCEHALQTILAKHESVLVERFIAGPELTVGLLEEKPLAPIRIVPKVDFFDYEAKYKRSDTEHRFDTGMPAELVEHCRALAEKANSVVGARDLARIDIMIDESTQKPYLLEINTLPGFTPKSLLPEAAAHAGIPFAQLVDRLVKRAAERGAR